MRPRHGAVPLAAIVVLAAVAGTAGVAAGAGSTDGAVGVDTHDAGATGVTSGQEACSFPASLADATGTEVRLDAEPTRVVTLNPSAAQTMWEIGAREKVVGLTKYAANLAGAASRTNVSTAEDVVSVERVVGLEPDLVLAPNATSRETVRKLRDAGVTVYHFREARSLADVGRKVETTGRLVGACGAAAARVDRMERDLAVVREAVEGTDRPDVLYSFYGYTAGEGTFIDTIIETAGGNNVAAANVTGYKPVNPEFVVAADPDWIIRNSDVPTVPRTDAYNSTTAVREGQVVVVNINHLNRPAPRVVNAVTKLAGTFHPEAYAAANATTGTATQATETATQAAGGTGGATTTTPAQSPTAGAATTTADGGAGTGSPTTTGTTVPGVGVPAAVTGLALLAGLLGGWRRR